MDVSARSLEIAARRLHADRMNERQRARLKLIQGSLIYRDARLEGFDAAVLMEVIEHLEPDRLRALERAVFEFARPATVVVTTPNAEYNVRFESCRQAGSATAITGSSGRATEFAAWADAVAANRLRSSVPAGRADDPSSARRPRWRSSSDEDRTPRAVTRRPGRDDRVRQVHVRPHDTSSRPRCCRRTSSAASSPTTRTIRRRRRRLRGAPLRRREAAGRRAADGDRRDQRPTWRPASRWSHSRASTTCCRSRSCSTSRSGSARRRNRGRPDRQFGPHVLARQRTRSRARFTASARRLPPRLGDSRRRRVGRDHAGSRSGTTARTCIGPFDIIGDVHGCGDELEALLGQLGYDAAERRDGVGLDAGPTYRHPDGRMVVFVGDLVDRGPRVLDCRSDRPQHARGRIRLWRSWATTSRSWFVPSAAGTSRSPTAWPTLAEIEAIPADERPAVRTELKNWLDGAAATTCSTTASSWSRTRGSRPRCRAAARREVREFALYGDTTGETDEFGLPVRYNWAADYRGARDGRLRPHADPRGRVAQQHDQCRHRLRLRRQADRAALPGAGARLGPGARTYYEPARPFLPPEDQAPKLSAQQVNDDVLDLADVTGKRIVDTRLGGRGDDPRGERGRGARGDEPVRRRSALARLPAADDVAVRDQRRTGSPRAPGRGVRLLPRRTALDES